MRCVKVTIKLSGGSFVDTLDGFDGGWTLYVCLPEDLILNLSIRREAP